MTYSTYSAYQIILVALLASYGLVTIGRWLRTSEYRIWACGWLSLFTGMLMLCLTRGVSGLDDQIFLLLHTICVAAFCVFMAIGTTIVSKVEDLRLYRVRSTHTSLFLLLTILSVLLILWRWPLEQRHNIFEERYLWSSPWFIGYSTYVSWIITRHQSRWYLRKANILYVVSLGILAVLDVFLLSVIALNNAPIVGLPGYVLNAFALAEPILLFLVALAMHTQVMDGLVNHLERTLVQVSKNSAKLKIMAERDPLTAVLNRHAFYSIVDGKRGGQQKPLGGTVAVLDLDNLKPLNDKYGHPTGDAAIRAVAKAIRSVIRAEDLLFRWGGDEFLVILPHVNLEEARWRFQKLDDLLKNSPLPGVPEPVNLTLSVGVSPFSSSNSLEKAIEEADERMYSRKSEKKDRLRIVPEEE
jgi:diguanylate cyclase (GGDEF)-like protein